MPEKRKTLTEQIEGWSVEGGDIVIEDLNRIEEIWEARKGYRWHSSSHQSAQDRTLREYRKWTALYLTNIGQGEDLTINGEAPDDINDALLFPSDASLQVEYACKYLIQASRRIIPQRPSKNTKIRVSTIISRRKHLWFWLAAQKIANACPTWTEYFTATQQCIRYISKELGGFNVTPYNKVYLGKIELVELVDSDMGRLPIWPSLSSITSLGCLAWFAE